MATKGTKNKSNSSGKNSGTKKNSGSASGRSRNGSSARETDKRGAERGVIDNIWGIILIVVGIFLFAAVQFNAAGQLGNMIGDFLRGVFGFIGLILPFYLIVFGILLLANKTVHISAVSAILGSLILLMLCLFNSGRFIDPDHIFFAPKQFYYEGMTLEGGGFFGMNIGMFLVKYLGKVGLYGVAAAITLVSLLLIINTPVSRAIESLKEKREDRALKKEEKRQIEEEYYRKEAMERREKRDAELAAYKQNVREEVASKRSKQHEASRSESIVEPIPAPDTLFSGTRGDFSAFRDGMEIELPPQVPDTAGPLNVNGYEPDVPDDYDITDTENDISDVVTGEPVDVIPGPKGRIQTFGIDEQRIPEPGYGLGEEYEVPVSRILPDDGDDDIAEVLPEPEPVQQELKGLAALDAADNYIPSVSSVKQPTNEAVPAVVPASGKPKKKRAFRYRKPPIDLLSQKPAGSANQAKESELAEKAGILEDTLKSFGVDAKVIDVTQGPAVTRYEIQPGIGVKVSKIVGLSNDIALRLRAKNIRTEAPIPGKAAVGIEVQNDKVNMVTLREVLESREFRQSQSKITFAVGRDIAGKAIVADLKSMPHLLIAGSTGSGKSVCINGIITSFLYKADPDEVKLVLIDPKKVELGVYNGIPHLLIPVVTEANKAAAALNWAVAEMDDRYKKFAENNVRDLAGYNEKLKAAGAPKEELMPQIVIIIDELADLMMVSPTQVEESICRLAQLARAAGMHIIVATQRPSVDVVTGLIKANIPSRIAFAVSSNADSRTILDMVGAEKLAGKGDMLFHPLGSGKPIRVQGCFIKDDEVNAVTDFVKSQIEEVEYADEILETVERGNVQEQKPQDEEEELLGEAIDLVMDAGQASTSMIQRRFRIGYNRAARIMESMEAMGIIGPQDGSKPRQVLLTKEEYEESKN